MKIQLANVKAKTTTVPKRKASQGKVKRLVPSSGSKRRSPQGTRQICWGQPKIVCIQFGSFIYRGRVDDQAGPVPAVGEHLPLLVKGGALGLEDVLGAKIATFYGLCPFVHQNQSALKT